MKRTLSISILLVFLLVGCASGSTGEKPERTTTEMNTEAEPRREAGSGTETEPGTEAGSDMETEAQTEIRAGEYQRISQEEARRMMEIDDGHVIVDVRRMDEYLEGHIPGAVLVPNEDIGNTPPSKLPDKDQIILVYCRSGRRSKEASQKLADMGYSRIYEFGGIIDWTGEVVSGTEK